MKHLLLAGSVSILLLSGCVSTNTTLLGQNTAGAVVAPEAVVIYRTAEQVPGPYKEIALLNSRGEATWTNEAQMYKSMRKEAGKIGANGIILDATSEPSAGARVAAAIFGVGVNRKGRAVAIYVQSR